MRTAVNTRTGEIRHSDSAPSTCSSASDQVLLENPMSKQLENWKRPPQEMEDLTGV